MEHNQISGHRQPPPIEQTFQHEIHKMQDNMQELKDKVDKILNVLTGNPINKKDTGMVGGI